MMDSRVPPYNEEAEQALLGAMLIDPVVLMDLVHRERITPEHFYVPANRTIFTRIEEFAAKHSSLHISSISIADYMKGDLDRVGGSLALDRLVDRVTTVAHSEFYITKIKDAWLFRCIISKARLAEGICYEEESGLDALAKAQSMFLDINYQRRLTNPYEIWEKAYNLWEAAENGELSGIMTPWSEFNDKTGGIPIGLSSALAGTMGSGKSYLLCNIALYLGLGGNPGGYFPFEDGNVRTMQRMVSLFAKLSAYHLMIGRAGMERLAEAKDAGPAIAKLPIGWHGERGMGTDDINAAIARGCAKHGWKWVFIDGFKDIKRNYKSNRNDEDDRRSNALADIAEKYNIALLSAHHITKQGGREQHDDKPLILQDLKGSGGILDDCRMITFLQKKDNDYVLDCQKTNHGKTGHIDLYMPDENVRLFVQKDKIEDKPEPVEKAQPEQEEIF